MPGLSPGVLTPTPAAVPTANLGGQAHAAGQVRQALTMLQTALPQIAIGDALHSAVLKAVESIAKHLPAASATGGALQDSMLRDLALRKAQQAPMLAAMQARGMGGAPASPPQPGSAGPTGA